MDNISITSFQSSTPNTEWDIDMVRGVATCEVQIKMYTDEKTYEEVTIELLCAVKYIDKGSEWVHRLEWAPSWEHYAIGDFVHDAVAEVFKSSPLLSASATNRMSLIRWIKNEIGLPKRASMDSIRSCLSIVAEDPDGRFVLEAGTALGASWIFLSDRKSSDPSCLCVWPFATQRDINDAVAEFFRISTPSLSQAILQAIESSKDQNFGMADYITSKEMA